jgi:hypothetical protein
MLTNLLLGLSLLTVAYSPPNFEGMTPLGTQSGECPDGVTMEVTLYDPDPSDPEALIVVFKKEGFPVGLLDAKANTLYVYADKKVYPLEEAKEKWPTACDFPTYKGI